MIEEADEILKRVVKAIEEEESGVSFVNTERVKEFVTCEMALRELLKGSRSTMEVVPHDGFSSVGVIRVLTEGFTIKDTQSFAEATSLASNYEIYARTDGKLMFALTFYGMTTKTGE